MSLVSEARSKRPPRPYWTPEEDTFLRKYGNRYSTQKISELLEKNFGTKRTFRGIQRRRRVIDAYWDTATPGMISLVSISGLGANLNAINPRALRQAEADGVLERRLIRGRLTAVVPIEWADAWIAESEKNSERHEELRAAGWYYTSEVAKILSISNSYCITALRNLRHHDGIWGVFKNVESFKLIDQRLLWEPTAMRTAIAAFIKSRTTQPKKRKVTK